MEEIEEVYQLDLKVEEARAGLRGEEARASPLKDLTFFWLTRKPRRLDFCLV